jgi:hypothetical protein
MTWGPNFLINESFFRSVFGVFLYLRGLVDSNTTCDPLSLISVKKNFNILRYFSSLTVELKNYFP